MRLSENNLRRAVTAGVTGTVAFVGSVVSSALNYQREEEQTLLLRRMRKF